MPAGRTRDGGTLLQASRPLRAKESKFASLALLPPDRSVRPATPCRCCTVQERQLGSRSREDSCALLLELLRLTSRRQWGNRSAQQRRRGREARKLSRTKPARGRRANQHTPHACDSAPLLSADASHRFLAPLVFSAPSRSYSHSCVLRPQAARTVTAAAHRPHQTPDQPALTTTNGSRHCACALRIPHGTRPGLSTPL